MNPPAPKSPPGGLLSLLLLAVLLGGGVHVHAPEASHGAALDVESMASAPAACAACKLAETPGTPGAGEAVLPDLLARDRIATENCRDGHAAPGGSPSSRAPPILL